MNKPTDAELDAIWHNSNPTNFEARSFARAVLAKWGQPAHSGEPVAFIHWPINGPPRLVWYSQKALNDAILKTYEGHQPDVKLYTTQPQAGAVPLTDREVELIDGMIQVQLDHASRCDAIANRAMADKQKGWDMERVALLQKLKANGIKGGQHER